MFEKCKFRSSKMKLMEIIFQFSVLCVINTLVHITKVNCFIRTMKINAVYYENNTETSCQSGVITHFIIGDISSQNYSNMYFARRA